VYWKTFQVAHVSRSEVLLSLLDRLNQSSKVSDTGEDCPISWWMDGSLLMLRHTRQCWHGTIGNKNSRRWHNPKKDKICHRFPLVISPHGFSTFLHLIHFQVLVKWLTRGVKSTCEYYPKLFGPRDNSSSLKRLSLVMRSLVLSCWSHTWTATTNILMDLLLLCRVVMMADIGARWGWRIYKFTVGKP
jgi:hypothetical protein